MTPPAISAGLPSLLPTRWPSTTPMKVITKVISPIRIAAAAIGYVVEEGEADPDRERVDAGGDRQDEQFADVDRVGVLLLVLVTGECLPQHLAADDGQQREGDPVVVVADVVGEAVGQQLADHRHDGLEHAEGDRDDQRAAVVEDRMCRPLPRATAKASAETPSAMRKSVQKLMVRSDPSSQ